MRVPLSTYLKDQLPHVVAQRVLDYAPNSEGRNEWVGDFWEIPRGRGKRKSLTAMNPFAGDVKPREAQPPLGILVLKRGNELAAHPFRGDASRPPAEIARSIGLDPSWTGPDVRIEAREVPFFRVLRPRPGTVDEKSNPHSYHVAVWEREGKFKIEVMRSVLAINRGHFYEKGIVVPSDSIMMSFPVGHVPDDLSTPMEAKTDFQIEAEEREKEAKRRERAVAREGLQEKMKVRKTQAFRLLGDGHPISAVAKGSQAQVHQIYEWMSKWGEGQNFDQLDMDEVPASLRAKAFDRCYRESRSFFLEVDGRMKGRDEEDAGEVFKEYGLTSREWGRLKRRGLKDVLDEMPGVNDPVPVSSLPRRKVITVPQVADGANISPDISSGRETLF